MSLPSRFVPGYHNKIGRTSKSIGSFNFLQNINMNFHWASPHIRDISWEKTINFIADGIVKLDLIDSCSDNDEIKLIHVEIFLTVRSAITIGYIGSYIVHKLKKTTNSDIGAWKLCHSLSQIEIVLEGQVDLIEWMARCGKGWDICQSFFSLTYTDVNIAAIEKCLNYSIFDIFFRFEIYHGLRAIEKGCFSDGFHVLLRWKVDSFGVGKWVEYSPEKNHRSLFVIISNLNSTKKLFI